MFLWTLSYVVIKNSNFEDVIASKDANEITQLNVCLDHNLSQMSVRLEWDSKNGNNTKYNARMVDYKWANSLPPSSKLILGFP